MTAEEEARRRQVLAEAEAVSKEAAVVSHRWAKLLRAARTTERSIIVQRQVRPDDPKRRR